MAQIFRPTDNIVTKIFLIISAILPLAIILSMSQFTRSSYVTKVGTPYEQPVPFSHEHHVTELGIDCRYCHTSVERSSFAGIPPTKTCMNCHSQIFPTSPFLEPVRASFRSGQSIVWTRVNDLPDFAYFNHSIHINKGVGCTTCHGPVDRMPLMWQAESLQMSWCIDCHRHPESYVRPREAVFRTDYVPPADQEALGRRLVAEYQIRKLTSCDTCHR